ncbi:MAG: hypothetical protein ACUVXF_07765 [Desulfobaccales bacterium]
MTMTTKICLVGLALALVLAGAASAQAGKAELWNGTHWKEFPKEIKVAYIKGIGNMADLEVAESGRDRSGCISVAFVDELKGKTIETIIQEVDKFYQENPDKATKPVIEIVLRQCTAYCRPKVAAPPEKK